MAYKGPGEHATADDEHNPDSDNANTRSVCAYFLGYDRLWKG